MISDGRHGGTEDAEAADVAGLVSGAGVAAFDDLVYGGPLKSGYRPGEISFSLGAIPRNVRFMPVHLIEATPMLVLGLVALAWTQGGG